jgi:hypothetical protein
VEHRNYKVVYRRYASLFFLVGVDNDEVWIPPALSPVCINLLLHHRQSSHQLDSPSESWCSPFMGICCALSSNHLAWLNEN